MSTERVSIEIRLQGDPLKLHPGQEVKGEMTVIPNTELGLNRFGYRVVMRIRGKLSASEHVEKEEILLYKTFWQAHQASVFPISFTVPEQPSYAGVNVAFDWALESVIDYDSETDAQIRGQSIRKLNLRNVLSPEWGSQASIPLHISYPDYPLVVEDSGAESKFLFSPGKKVGIRVAVLITLGLLVVVTQQVFLDNTSFGWGPIIGVILLAIAGLAGYYYYAKSMLGKVDMQVAQAGKDSLELQVQIEKNSTKIRSIEAWYEVREKVVDDRGTSTVTHNVALFESEKVSISPVQRQMRVSLLLPAEQYPYTSSRQYVSLYWVVKMRVNIGLPCAYEKEIWVSRKGYDPIQWN